LDEPDSPPKKQKISKAAAAKAKATKKKKKKDDEDSDEDAYTALSKSMGTSSTPKPAVGSFAECATCGKQFTVVSSLRVC
jgi:DNA repair protein RAD7